MANIYAPNVATEQVNFFNEITQTLHSLDSDPDSNILIGSDFDVTFDHAQVKNQISIKVLEVLKLSWTRLVFAEYIQTQKYLHGDKKTLHSRLYSETTRFLACK